MMDARTRLENFSLLGMKAEMLENRIDRLEALVNRVNSFPDNTPVQGGSNNHIELIDRLIDMRDQYSGTLNEYMIEYELVMQQIDRMENPLYAEIILERYVDRLCWDDIAKNVGFSQQHARQYLHNKSLEHFEESNKS